MTANYDPTQRECPFCGKRIFDHKAPKEVWEHATSWLADPDRTNLEIVMYLAGAFNGLQAMLREELPLAFVLARLEEQIQQLIEVGRRLAAMAEEES